MAVTSVLVGFLQNPSSAVGKRLAIAVINWQWRFDSLSSPSSPVPVRKEGAAPGVWDSEDRSRIRMTSSDQHTMLLVTHSCLPQEHGEQW